MAMTQADVEAWLSAQGVNPHVISDEAGYVTGKYGQGGESYTDEAGLMQVLQSSLPSYIQRTLSGGDRSAGGYSTDENDPAVTRGDYTPPARYDSSPWSKLVAGEPGSFAASQVGRGRRADGTMPMIPGGGLPFLDRSTVPTSGYPGLPGKQPGEWGTQPVPNEQNLAQLMSFLRQQNIGMPNSDLDTLARKLQELGVLGGQSGVRAPMGTQDVKYDGKGYYIYEGPDGPVYLQDYDPTLQRQSP